MRAADLPFAANRIRADGKKKINRRICKKIKNKPVRENPLQTKASPKRRARRKTNALFRCAVFFQSAFPSALV
jgi:hypothetical protein